MNNVFKGLGIALVTPFLENGEVDYDTLGMLIEKQLAGKTDFFCVLGSTAETPCLSNDEKLRVKNFSVERIAGRVPVLMGFGGNCTHALTEEIRSFDFSGVDGILSVCPFYNKPSQEGIFRHFKAVAKASKLPIVVYNVPGRTGINMTAATTLRLARELPNIVAVKEASGNIAQIEEILSGKPASFDVISGDDSITYELLSLGAAGVISVIGNALPDIFGEMVHCELAGNISEALPIHHKLSNLFKLLSADGNPAGIKAMLSEMHLCRNLLRLPLVPARTETQAAIRKELESLP